MGFSLHFLDFSWVFSASSWDLESSSVMFSESTFLVLDRLDFLSADFSTDFDFLDFGWFFSSSSWDLESFSVLFSDLIFVLDCLIVRLFDCSYHVCNCLDLMIKKYFYYANSFLLFTSFAWQKNRLLSEKSDLYNLMPCRKLWNLHFTGSSHFKFSLPKWGKVGPSICFCFWNKTLSSSFIYYVSTFLWFSDPPSPFFWIPMNP